MSCEEERSLGVTRALLRFVVVDLQAEAGAIFRVVEHAPPFRVAQTERFDQRGDNLTQSAWMHKRVTLLKGEVVRTGQCLVMPLFRGEPVLKALLFLAGVPESSGARLEEQRANLDRLARLIEADPVPSLEGWLLVHSEDPEKARIEAALSASRGVVAHAARLLGRPQRTLWDQIRRLGIDPRAFRPSPA